MIINRNTLIGYSREDDLRLITLYMSCLMYAKWGVDYLKYDWCSDEGQNAQAAYATMSDAIKESGRPIILSICEWGEHEPWKWGKGIGHLWRVTADIRDCYQCLFDWVA